MTDENIKCPYCQETIKAEAKKCRYCGEWINKIPSISVSNKDAKDDETKKEEGLADWVYYELFAIGGLIWGLSDSWVLGLIVAIVGIVLMNIPVLGYLLCWLIGLAWGIVAGGFSGYFFHSPTLGWIIGIIIFISISYGHLEARKK